MRLMILSVFIMLSGCAQLTNGQQQPVIEKNTKEKIYFTTCSGMAEGWPQCNEKAMNKCTNGYLTLKRDEVISAVYRGLTFQCKK